MGCSCRMFREEPLARPCVCWAEPFIKNRVSEEIAEEGSRNPALWESGRGSRFWQRVRPGFFPFVGNPTHDPHVRQSGAEREAGEVLAATLAARMRDSSLW